MHSQDSLPRSNLQSVFLSLPDIDDLVQESCALPVKNRLFPFVDPVQNRERPQKIPR